MFVEYLLSQQDLSSRPTSAPVKSRAIAYQKLEEFNSLVRPELAYHLQAKTNMSESTDKGLTSWESHWDGQRVQGWWTCGCCQQPHSLLLQPQQTADGQHRIVDRSDKQTYNRKSAEVWNPAGQLTPLSLWNHPSGREQCNRKKCVHTRIGKRSLSTHCPDTIWKSWQRRFTEPTKTGNGVR